MDKYEPCEFGYQHKGEQYVEGVMREINLAAVFCGNCGEKYTTPFEEYGVQVSEE